MLPKRTIKRVVPGMDRSAEEAKYQEGLPPAAPTDENIIVSPDTRRENRIPPGQARTRKWPVLDAYGAPEIDLDEWKLAVFGMTDHPVEWTWDQFQTLQTVNVFADMHCVTRWSRLGNRWEGVSTQLIKEVAPPLPSATHVLLYGYDGGWTTNVPIDEFFAEDVLIATHHDGQPISIEHGGPARVVVPRLYAWKSAKWIRAIEYMASDRPGFWERGGYHMNGNPWNEERFGG